MNARTGWQDPAWRAWRIEGMRRSLAMLGPEQLAGLSRDEAYNLITEVQSLQSRLEYIRRELRRLAEET